MYMGITVEAAESGTLDRVHRVLKKDLAQMELTILKRKVLNTVTQNILKINEIIENFKKYKR